MIFLLVMLNLDVVGSEMFLSDKSQGKRRKQRTRAIQHYLKKDLKKFDSKNKLCHMRMVTRKQINLVGIS